MKETEEVWRGLAGPLYDALVENREAAFLHIFNTDWKVRIAAIHVCQSAWQGSADRRFVDACRQLAGNDPNDLVRQVAIHSFGEALRSSKDVSACRFLAAIVNSALNSEQVRRAAYFALREVHLGLTEEDFVRSNAALMKEALHELPLGMSEEEVKRVVLCGGRFPGNVWDTAEKIDWDFVEQFANREE